MINKIAPPQEENKIISQLSLKEKISLCSGEDCWHTKSIPRLQLTSIMMSDGPHGLRKQIGSMDNLGIGESVPAVCFPTASALACSFNKELLFEVGKAIGEECVAYEVSILLGPGANQKRSPLCGRNFEYFSEDPIVSGELAAAMINGIQSTGTFACLKHFAVNNQEKRRMTISAVIDERTLRETYLKAFEIAVKKGRPHTIMCSYNKINGTYASEHKFLLDNILRKEWGFDGAIISDWGAVCDRAQGIAAGLDLEMPGNHGYHDDKIQDALAKGTLTTEALTLCAQRMVHLTRQTLSNKKTDETFDQVLHHILSINASEQSAVLLKNDDALLPAKTTQTCAVIGSFAKTPRIQGAGSSKVHPIFEETPYHVLKEMGIDFTYAPGYLLEDNTRNETKKKKEEEILRREACTIAKEKDLVFLFAGLPEGYESEGFDRENLKMPIDQIELIDAVSACNSNVVVILLGGAPMELPWRSKVKSILMAYLGGEGIGRAIVNLLFGYRCPCGKLAETWPLSLDDTPCYNYFPGNRLTTEYRESIYVGYKYYEKSGKPVLYPFGHGLSYTSFSYSNLVLDTDSCEFGDVISLSFHITNIGDYAGYETSFVFISHQNEIVFLPEKELKEFTHVMLYPGETKQIRISLDTKTFGYYNTLIKDWYCESGEYQLLIGSSSDQIHLNANLKLHSCNQPQPDLRLLAPSYYTLRQDHFTIADSEYEVLYGTTLPSKEFKGKRPYTRNHTLEDIQHTFVGKLLICYANHIAKKATKEEKEQEGMMMSMIFEMPFFSLVSSGDGLITDAMMEGILDLLNGHYGKGIRKLLK